MHASATDKNGIKTSRDVAQIQFLLPKEEKNWRIEVYFDETITAPDGRQISKGWRNDPLILDLSEPKIVQAIELLKEVIKQAEWVRITTNQGRHKTPESIPANMPIPGVTPTPSPLPTPTPPQKL